MGSNHGEDQMNINERMKNFKERLNAEKPLSKKKKELEKAKNLSQKFDALDNLRGKEPDGKLPPVRLTPGDESDIRFSIGTSMDKKRVVMNFGKQIRWVGMSRNQAIDVGKALIKSAKETII